MRAHRFRQAPYVEGLHQHQGQQRPIDQLSRQWCELHQHTAAHRAAGHAEQRRHAVDQRALLAVGIEQCGAQYGGGHTGSEPLQGPRGNQPGHAVFIDKQQHRQHIQDQCGKNHRLASQVIRQ
ncbi:hypothetical protein ACVWXR_002565 [Pseudomonas lurida]